jgi:hypothetical protein
MGNVEAKKMRFFDPQVSGTRWCGWLSSCRSHSGAAAWRYDHGIRFAPRRKIAEWVILSTLPSGTKKAPFFGTIFVVKLIILPRQARDKHSLGKKTPKKEWCFLAQPPPLGLTVFGPEPARAEPQRWKFADGSAVGGWRGGAESSFFGQFLYESDHFAKTGSGWTSENLREKRRVSQADDADATAAASEAAADGAAAAVPEGEELNVALQAEVLYFTLLGLRTAAAGEHLWWGGQPGDAKVDLVAAIRSGAEASMRGSTVAGGGGGGAGGGEQSRGSSSPDSAGEQSDKITTNWVSR